MPRAGRAVAAVLLGGVLAGTLGSLAGCTGDGAGTVLPRPGEPPATPGSRALEAAVSDPVEDPVYPEVGDPGVDALHYDLDLAWTPHTDTLTAEETLLLRATADAGSLRLDLAAPLHVTSLQVDGEDTAYDHTGKDLVVHTPVREDRRYALTLAYQGTPRPVPAPTTRKDIATLGWTTTDRHEAWTMQEPFGAYSWYAVNDQPSDKALYDITVSAPDPMVGVANGRLVSRDDTGGTTVTSWHLDEPAASYLVTVAVGEYDRTRDRSASGVPLEYWTPRDRPGLVADLRGTATALDWLEARLGGYPFSSLGVVVVDSTSGMETQTMLTLGDTDYATSPEVLVHEVAHQWYGDQVTPRTWRDLWMNEGMAMYLQGVWEARHTHQDLDALMRFWASGEPELRERAGPPADYDPDRFGDGNVYVGAALMWHALRGRLGDAEFWRLAAAWPRSHDDGNASYDELVSWWSRESGEDLGSFFDDWLLADRAPPG